MLLEPFVIYPLNIGNGMYGPTISVVLMSIAEIIIPIDLGEDLHKFLFRVGDLPEQFVVEMQDAGTNFIRFALIVHCNVLFQLRLCSTLAFLKGRKLVQDIRIQGSAITAP